MRLVVEHRTHYRFAPAARYIVQSLKLTPSQFDGQKVINWSITAEGCVINSEFIDGNGDTISTLTATGPVDSVDVVVTGEIETSDTTGVLRGHKERAFPAVFLRSTPVTKSSAAIRKLAAKIEKKTSPDNLLERAHEISTAVSKAIEYAPGATHVHTTAADALADGKGVCQDHTHVMLSIARHLGIPARYVSGYLFADSDGLAHEASHAWAELYLPELGWVGFDPANNCCPTEYYIRLGSGLDAQIATPIRGVHTGGANEDLNVTVIVAQSQQ
ncbi:transglutaminase family protein [Thalassospira alkalitolerans]|uniref:Transglutaminase n=1 Tax=Thalassospira alkalitolerans TaxID=1293890 RepID=A0A1Y2LFZ7_9PROT|nr:transglutaminase family protein [Thalassospira alkalitolerans]OSQ50259.1 transglutaminase [Thalassospira alkalitolerans]|tara:strand:+ start:60825 stop:61643 length:819 start_codon:yes stop_codon:yes gene_type:complete